MRALLKGGFDIIEIRGDCTGEIGDREDTGRCGDGLHEGIAEQISRS